MNISFVSLLIINSFFTTGVPGRDSDIRFATTEKCARADSGQKKGQNVRICFWNIENLYDAADDTAVQDEEFTPEGVRRWSVSRYYTKINHLSKVMLAMGEGDAPGLIGLCEVENRSVLNRLVRHSPLARYGYRSLHFESPDRRGVDVALLYRPSSFRPLYARPISIRFPFDTLARTRDILMVTGLLWERDTLTLFVNHWPSRRGGQAASQPRRDYVARALRSRVDSILARNPLANILIMGDFNDEPHNESLQKVLGACTSFTGTDREGLFNLMAPRAGKEGTHCFRGEWALLDQFIVSGALLTGVSGLTTGTDRVTIYKAPFMLREDGTWLVNKPRRTYNGPAYEGGFSDHLPVLIRLFRPGSP